MIQDIETNRRYRSTSIPLGLNRLSVRALKTLRQGLKGQPVTQTEILSATAILDLLAAYGTPTK